MTTALAILITVTVVVVMVVILSTLMLPVVTAVRVVLAVLAALAVLAVLAVRLATYTSPKPSDCPTTSAMSTSTTAGNLPSGEPPYTVDRESD
jgi:hypothetical protein